MNNPKLKRYLIAVFVPTLILDIIGIAALAKLDNLSGATIMTWTMAFVGVMPTLGAVIAKADFRNMGWKPYWNEDAKTIFLTWITPIVISLAGMFFYYIIFRDDFDMRSSMLEEFDEGAYQSLSESGFSYFNFIMGTIVGAMLKGIIAMPLALGEEIGWRGFMYPELKKDLGITKGRIVGGIIWGIWHLPLMLAGYEYGRDYIGAPFLGSLVFCLFCVSTGIIMDHVYEKTNCIWVPALFHGTVNSTNTLEMLFRGTEHQERMIFGPADIGLISMIPIIALAVYLTKREEKEMNTL